MVEEQPSMERNLTPYGLTMSLRWKRHRKSTNEAGSARKGRKTHTEYLRMEFQRDPNVLSACAKSRKDT